MALEARSFFIGIATVLGLLVVGFGGGVMMGGVISGDPKAPNKLERQAGKEAPPPPVKDVKPAVVEAKPQPKDPAALAKELDAIKPSPQPTVVTPAKSEPVPEQAKAEAKATPEPQQTSPQVESALGAAQAGPAQASSQTAPAPVTKLPRPEPQPVPSPQTTQQAAVPPPVGAQKPVALVQPADELPSLPSLSRREQARLRAHQRREERAQRREERRKLFAERRQQEQLRRAELKAAERPKPEAADEDDDDRDDAPPAFMQRRGPFGGPLFRLFGN